MKSSDERAPGELDACLAELDAGEDFVSAFEQLLRDLPPDRSNRLMLLHREGRGAWYPLLLGGSGTALFLGNAQSGTWLPLALNGYRVVVVDRAAARVRFARHRARAHARDAAWFVVAGDGSRLPFADGAFDVVVQEEGLPGTRGSEFAHDVAECRRVCRGELVLTAENRLAYKRSTGRRGDFRVAPPWTWARKVIAPRAGQRTLSGYRAALASPEFEPARAFALYPHARDFTHVVSLEQPWPKLLLGPKERKNKLKLVGHALGLFPVLTPAFALIAARRDARGGETRLDRALEALAERIGEPRPRAEHWTATRGNSAVVLTALEDSGAEPSDPRGRWALHLPMSPKEKYELGRHSRNLRLLRERFPDFPAPEHLFTGEVEGMWLVVERRVEGLGAPQLSGDREFAARLFARVARDYSALVTEAASPLGEDDLAELVDAKFELVGRYARLPETRKSLERTRGEVRELLGGLVVPRVFYHADLRGKHVRVRPDGEVVGYLDFGASEFADLPYFDLLHLVVHERMIEEASGKAGHAWRVVRDGTGLREHERRALDDYSARLALPAEYRRAIETAYPVLVAAMAEKNWDYSRPHWLHRHFGF